MKYYAKSAVKEGWDDARSAAFWQISDFFQKFQKKVLTNSGESAILCKLSDTDTRFRGADKKVLRKMKKGLDKRKRMCYSN